MRGGLAAQTMSFDTSPAIRTTGLTRRFGTLAAVDGLSIEVPRGEIFGFLGPNGAGKTTTIRLLLGLLDPSAGSAEVLGFDTRRQASEIRRNVGVVLEHTGLYEQLGAEDNLEFHARAWGLPRSRRGARIRELLEGMGLWDRRREPVGGWSKGMQQRLALARALLANPPLVFLDEPTVGLDVLAAKAVRDDLARQAELGGTTVFLTTHNMVEAERLCRTVAVIRNGRLLAAGSPAELRSGSGSPRLEIVGRNLPSVSEALASVPGVTAAEREDGHLLLSLQNGADPGPVVAALVRHGVEIDEVRRDRGSLEDAFVALVEEEPA